MENILSSTKAVEYVTEKEIENIWNSKVSDDVQCAIEAEFNNYVTSIGFEKNSHNNTYSIRRADGSELMVGLADNVFYSDWIHGSVSTICSGYIIRKPEEIRTCFEGFARHGLFLQEVRHGL